jgi:type II secretory pathway component PulL
LPILFVQARNQASRRLVSLFVFAFVALLVLLFAVAMRIYHGQDENNDEDRDQQDNYRLIFPNLSNKLGRLRIHLNFFINSTAKEISQLKPGGTSLKDGGA